jgi:hypothetical protein
VKTQACIDLWTEAATRFHDPAGGINIVIGPVTVGRCRLTPG